MKFLTKKDSIHVEQHEDYIPNKNLMLQDAYHMGQFLGTNAYMLFPNHTTEPTKYVIIVNTLTGESIRVFFNK